MVKCERAALVLFISYLQRLLERECRESRDQLRCVLTELEKVKARIEEFELTEIERELFS